MYVFDEKAQWTTSATIHPPVAQAFANFGASLSLSGTTLAVGAPGDFRSLYANTTNIGAVYSYTGSASSWTFQGGIQPTDGATTDGYGWAVGVSDAGTNGTILVVGSPYNDAAGLTDSGAAYVYRWASSEWLLQGKLTASDAVASGNFGFAVAALSDTTVLVGAPGTSEVYEFTYDGAAWTQSTLYTSCHQAIGWNMASYDQYVATGKGNDVIIDTSLPNTGCIAP
ncbi:MAG: hypothetical protein ACRELB_16875 [Polyangiaceae bacterium]